MTVEPCTMNSLFSHMKILYESLVKERQIIDKSKGSFALKNTLWDKEIGKDFNEEIRATVDKTQKAIKFILYEMFYPNNFLSDDKIDCTDFSTKVKETLPLKESYIPQSLLARLIQLSKDLDRINKNLFWDQKKRHETNKLDHVTLNFDIKRFIKFIEEHKETIEHNPSTASTKVVQAPIDDEPERSSEPSHHAVNADKGQPVQSKWSRFLKIACFMLCLVLILGGIILLV